MRLCLLFSNATKFNRPEGSIFVKLSDMGDNILIFIRNTGIGSEVCVKLEVDVRHEVNAKLKVSAKNFHCAFHILKQR
jgi:hypothetical protein